MVFDVAETQLDDAGVKSLAAVVQAELVIATYDFARRKALRELQDLGLRVLQSPVSGRS